MPSYDDDLETIKGMQSMSLSSLLASVEQRASNLNPLTIARAAAKDVEIIKSDIAELKVALVILKPAIESLLTLLPPTVAVPAEVLTLLSSLPAAPAPLNPAQPAPTQ